MTVQAEPLWTPRDVSDYLGVPVATLYQWRWKKYGPPAARVGRNLRYRPAAVEAWLDSVTEAA
ncbi:helix-turn-helix transcriptional regulator [Jiangella muralis]|uniref:helix-turn-helix transcriptional regulator n=1 Tax=Jiangella muralis TaxID=702383 RepID=UPI00069E962A|nr:helix-turn-helix domain-containing protein [Jiangella muralis]